MTERYPGKPYLVKERQGNVSPKVTRPNEGACTVCNSRVTVNPDGGEEYGHNFGCIHRPKSLPNREDFREFRISNHICSECGRGDFDSDEAVEEHFGRVHGYEGSDSAQLNLDTDRGAENITLECAHCGDSYPARPTDESSRKYCSQECHREARSSRVELVCEHCDDEFSVMESRVTGRKYCSLECQKDARQNRVELQCDLCDELFKVIPSKADNRRYCSRSCYKTAKQRRVELQCELCDEPFYVIPSKADSRQYCSPDCYYEDISNRVTLSCEHCGDAFEVKGSKADHRKHCSTECRNQWFSEHPTGSATDSTGGVSGD